MGLAVYDERAAERLLAGWGATILVFIQLDLFLRNC